MCVCVRVCLRACVRECVCVCAGCACTFVCVLTRTSARAFVFSKVVVSHQKYTFGNEHIFLHRFRVFSSPDHQQNELGVPDYMLAQC